MPDRILSDFFTRFERSFRPPLPNRKQDGSDWIVSGRWSDYMRTWLKDAFDCMFEYPGRLDAALWPKASGQRGRMDIALEWEWDNNKVRTHFPYGDFRKVLKVDARCGLAIVHTRVDGRRSPEQADEFRAAILNTHARNRVDDRPVGVIEIRRTINRLEHLEFHWTAHRLGDGRLRHEGRYTFHSPNPKT